MFLFLLLLGVISLAQAQNTKQNISLVIHGGAGTILKENMTPELEKAYRAKLDETLTVGYDLLKKGESSETVVVAVIKILEDSPLFNAGKGAVFTNEGKNEMDAAIMRGADLKAGAVAGVTKIKNPIEAALAVMNHSPHVMMARKGAEQFAIAQGIETVDPSYFFTQKRMDQLNKAKAKTTDSGSLKDWEITDFKYGTVGAVALDQLGNLTAATSTGGMTNKMYGRIGDTPIIGAGTYANNKTCAVSCTGHGEYFMRALVAYEVSARMEYKHETIKKAAKHVIHKKLTDMGGKGGLIALDRQGNITMTFNTPGMYRGYIKADGTKKVMIYTKKEEK